MKKIANIGLIVIVALLTLELLGSMLFCGFISLVQDRTDGDLGYRVLSIETENAAGLMNEGDLAFAKVVPHQALEQGTAVVCRSADPDSYGLIQVCTVDSVSEDGVKLTDGAIIPNGFVLGEFRTAIPHGGTFLQKMKTAEGFSLLIVLPMVVLFTLIALQSLYSYRNKQKLQTEA